MQSPSLARHEKYLHPVRTRARELQVFIIDTNVCKPFVVEEYHHAILGYFYTLIRIVIVAEEVVAGRTILVLDNNTAAVGCSDGRIIAGTARQGLVLKNGPAVQVLVAPWRTETEELAWVNLKSQCLK